jgi:prevent-host-death family protein
MSSAFCPRNQPARERRLDQVSSRLIRMVLASKSPEKLAVVMAMSVSEQMSLADVKNRLSEVVDRLEREHGRVVITKHGHAAAVVISVEDLESLEETSMSWGAPRSWLTSARRWPNSAPPTHLC